MLFYKKLLSLMRGKNMFKLSEELTNKLNVFLKGFITKEQVALINGNSFVYNSCQQYCSGGCSGNCTSCSDSCYGSKK